MPYASRVADSDRRLVGIAVVVGMEQELKPYYKVNVDFANRNATIHAWRCGTIPFATKKLENGHWRGFSTKEQAEEYAYSLELLRVGDCELCL